MPWNYFGVCAGFYCEHFKDDVFGKHFSCGQPYPVKPRLMLSLRFHTVEL